MTEERLNEIEKLALAATPNPVAKMNRTKSGCGTDFKKGEAYNYDIWGYEMREKENGKLIIGGVMDSEKGIKPPLPSDIVFFEQARSIVLELIREIRKH